jgi:hypothetical protein
MGPGRRATAVLLAATIFMAGAAVAGCGAASSSSPKVSQPGQRNADMEQRLLESMGPSTDLRYTHVRCFDVRGHWRVACTFQRISPRQGQDDPLLVLGYRYEGDRMVSATGTAPLDIACADDLRCWVRTLCFVTGQCEGTGLFPADGAGAPPLRTPTPTPARCVSAWNVHGGFSPAEVAQENPLHVSMAVARPVYTPHLAGASFGFIGARAEVQATHSGCLVRFELGDGSTYPITAEALGEARFWMWQGAMELEQGSEPAWNACQREDGTLFLATSCPPVGATPRAVADELERGYLQSLADAGGIPYWLGRTFAGARPVPVLPPPRGAQSAVAYANADGVDLLVLTYQPPDRGRTTRGFIVARAEPETATVLVVADREVPADFSQAVRAALRPFISTEPDAEQLPGDLEEEPTRIDTSAPVITNWVGSPFQGFEAAVVGDAPEGAGVVRYSKSNVEWFLVTYVPLPKKHCGRTGCVSPPPLPHALEQYGEVKDTLLRYGEGEPLVVVLTRRPNRVPGGMAIFDALEPLR